MWGFQTSRRVVERLGSDGAARGVAGSLTGAAAHALDEVNHLTDFHVEISAIKKGRAVEKLFMTWLKKSPADMNRAQDEREKSRVGRRARWHSKVERITFNEQP